MRQRRNRIFFPVPVLISASFAANWGCFWVVATARLIGDGLCIGTDQMFLTSNYLGATQIFMMSVRHKNRFRRENVLRSVLQIRSSKLNYFISQLQIRNSRYRQKEPPSCSNLYNIRNITIIPSWNDLRLTMSHQDNRCIYLNNFPDSLLHQKLKSPLRTTKAATLEQTMRIKTVWWRRRRTTVGQWGSIARCGVFCRISWSDLLDIG